MSELIFREGNKTVYCCDELREFKRKELTTEYTVSFDPIDTNISDSFDFQIAVESEFDTPDYHYVEGCKFCPWCGTKAQFEGFERGD